MATKMEAEMKEHHKKLSLCGSRPKYREARWSRAVKVYTINLESKYLLVQGVPALDVTKDLLETFAIYGAIDEYRILDDYPAEEFTKVYWIKFKHIMAARKAKRKLDNRSFFGGILHVSYAPEFESVEETREKLMERKRNVQRKLNYARKQPKFEQESRQESHSLQHDNSDSTSTTSSRMNIAEVPDRESLPSTTSMGGFDEAREHVGAIENKSTYTPFPPRLPPLTVPTYPSQVPTMSTSLNSPQNSRIFTSDVPATTELKKIGQPCVAASRQAKTSLGQGSYGYNSDVSLPAKPPTQGLELVRSGKSSDNITDSIYSGESLTGDLSLDRTVLSIREKLNKVNKRSIAETQVTSSSDKKKKQRKRI